jgi:hypothetical protein
MWFAAKLLFEDKIIGPASRHAAHDPLQHESIRLIHAEAKAGAMLKARRLGQGFKLEYLNSDGESVKWRFIEVLDLQKLHADEIHDGTEVYYDLRLKSGRPLLNGKELRDFVCRLAKSD